MRRALLIVPLLVSPAFAAPRVYVDAVEFLTDTRAVVAVGLSSTTGYESLLTESGVELRQADGFELRVVAQPSTLGGNTLIAVGPEDLDLRLAAPETAFGLFLEDRMGAPDDVDTPDVCPGLDSAFVFTFRTGGPAGAIVASFQVDPELDVASFAGVVTELPFDFVQIREVPASGPTDAERCENDAFGRVLLGVPQHWVNRPPSVTCPHDVELAVDQACDWMMVPGPISAGGTDPEHQPLRCWSVPNRGHGLGIVGGAAVRCQDICGAPSEKPCYTNVVPRDRLPPRMQIAQTDVVLALHPTWQNTWVEMRTLCGLSWTDNCAATGHIRHGLIGLTSTDPNEHIGGGPGGYTAPHVVADWYRIVFDLDESRGAVARTYALTYATVDDYDNLSTVVCRVHIQ